jgi:hypothetical protein
MSLGLRQDGAKADLQALKKLKLDCDWIHGVVRAKKGLSDAEL